MTLGRVARQIVLTHLRQIIYLGVYFLFYCNFLKG